MKRPRIVISQPFGPLKSLDGFLKVKAMTRSPRWFDYYESNKAQKLAKSWHKK